MCVKSPSRHPFPAFVSHAPVFRDTPRLDGADVESGSKLGTSIRSHGTTRFLSKWWWGVKSGVLASEAKSLSDTDNKNCVLVTLYGTPQLTAHCRT
eukprot:1903410-Prymnesium_polylepis.1